MPVKGWTSGRSLSRHDGKLTAAGEAILDAAELLQALRARGGSSPDERNVAIARYLAAGEGWRDASKLLGGAFADPGEAADEAADDEEVKR